MRITSCVPAIVVAAVLMSGNPVLSDMSQTNASALGRDGAGSDLCVLITPPPVRLQTNSKYGQDFGSRSIVDEAAFQRRRQALAPVEESIRNLQILVMPQAATATPVNSIQCAIDNLDIWARAGALTDMATTDANLSRDRLMASIMEVLIFLESRQPGLARRKDIRRWLTLVAAQTMDYYDLRAGSTSRRNNHRYWAGLSVGRIGYFLNERSLLTWASKSVDIGLCEVDAEGFLPLELARAQKALDYHLYAYTALRSLNDLLNSDSRYSQRECPDGLIRLQARIGNGLRNVSSFEMRSGYDQDAPSRKNVLSAIRLSHRPPGASPLHPGIDYLDLSEPSRK